MNEDKIDAKLIEDLREYLKIKTGRLYFKYIRQMADNIQVTCPFHKQGNENKASANIRITPSDRAYPGLFSCFSCKETMPLDRVLAKILGPIYDEEEVENLFHLKILISKNILFQEKKEPLFKIPKNEYIRRRCFKKL